MNLCHTNASCTNTNGSYECQCLPGFTGDGVNCSSKRKFRVYIIIPLTYTLSFFSDINECDEYSLNNCSENANCTDTIGSYECTCLEGYSGDGISCEGISVFWVYLLLALSKFI